MDRLSRGYKQEEGDPCSKLLETESPKRLEAMKAIVQSYDEDKDSITQGLADVRWSADGFLKLITSGQSEKLGAEGNVERIQSQVREVQEQLKLHEQATLELWQLRRTLADHCVRYLDLEQCAKEVRCPVCVLRDAQMNMYLYL